MVHIYMCVWGGGGRDTRLYNSLWVFFLGGGGWGGGVNTYTVVSTHTLMRTTK